MRPNEIEKHRRKTPFQPFRLILSNGQSYEVRHPEMIFVSRTNVIIATAIGEDNIVEDTIFCDPIHVSNIELINGEPPRKRKSKRK
jgi:hypothetical protein